MIHLNISEKTIKKYHLKVNITYNERPNKYVGRTGLGKCGAWCEDLVHIPTIMVEAYKFDLSQVNKNIRMVITSNHFANYTR